VLKTRLALLAVLSTMVIYGSNFAVSRYATQHGLAPPDMVALRFAVAGLIMLPVFLLRGGTTCAGLGWKKGVVLAILSGAPMTLLMNIGLQLAPAAHGASIGPGTVTTVGIVYGMVAAARTPSAWTVAGLGAILAGLATLAIAGSVGGTSKTLLGDGLFFLMGALWGTYPIVLHRWRVDPITSAAVVSVLSLAYLPVYLAFETSRLGDVPVSMLLFQALYQGPLNVVLGLFLWGYGVKTLGAARTQLFPPLIPVLGTLFAVPILGEIPGPFQVLGIAAIVCGILLSILGSRRRPAARSLTEP
jgi:drug/metabolite transporter (DMT)-like permease